MFDEVVIALPQDGYSIIPDLLQPEAVRTAVQQKRICLWVTLKEEISGTWNRLNLQNPLDRIDIFTRSRRVLRIKSKPDWGREHWDEDVESVGQSMLKSTWSLFGGESNIQSIECERILTLPQMPEGVQIANRRVSFCGSQFGDGGVQGAWLSACASLAQIMQNRHR